MATKITNDNITSVDAAKLSGTIADARFPATLPAISGANLTGISAGFTEGTKVDTTSGVETALFTGIPSGVTKIFINFDNVSLFISSRPLITIGDSGGLETTGYNTTGANIKNGTGIGSTNNTAAFIIGDGTGANDSLSGILLLSLQDSSDNTWCMTGTLAGGTSTITIYSSGGSKTLSGELTQIGITSSAGQSGQNFDAGEINISYM
jgi:hypothetical protein|tara:strand:- start:490 stop:1113 length:624 start_codon:yes stop_codon:yes gene_type:complete